MTGARELDNDRKNGSDRPVRAAATDLLLVLGTLFAVKIALLRSDALWTYAGPISLLASVAVASWCLQRRGQSWADLGLKRPASIPKMLFWSFAILVATIAAGIVIELAISSSGIGNGGNVDPRYSQRFANLPGNTPLFLYWILVSWLIGGFVEEMLFRGMLISRFEALFKGFPIPVSMAVISQSILFGQQHHYYQGWSGALATGGIALLSGTFYLMLKRNLWPLILSHGVANTIGMTLIYTGIQSAS